MRPIPPPEIQNIQIPKVEKKHEASLFKITLIPGIGALLVVWYGSLLQQATEKRRACSLRRTAECRCRRSLPASRPATTHPASQKVGKQRKEGRLAACSLACFSRSWRKVYSQLSACSSLLSIGRSVHGLTTDHTEDEQTNERADIYGNDACDGGGGQKKASVVHPEAFLESRAGSSSNGVSGPRLLLPPLLLTVARSSSLLLLLWLVSSRRDHGGLSTQSGRQTGSAAIDFCP